MFKKTAYGYKNSSHSDMFGKNVSMQTFKTNHSSAARVPTINLTSGIGDTVGGAQVHGNTHHAIANAQRDGQPRDFRQTFGKRMSTNGAKLESRKRNKTG